MKRPLLAVLAFVVILSLFAVYHTKLPECDSFFEIEAPVSLSGTIYQIEEKSNSTAIYIKNISFHSINSNITKQTSYGTDDILVYSSDPCNLCIGNKILVTGTMQKLSKGTNPGQFNEFIFYKSKNIDYKLFAKQLDVIEPTVNSYFELLRIVKKRISSTYKKYLPEQDAGLLSSMLLGDKSSVSQDIKELYQKSGISHILAISGLHISFLGLSLYKLLKKCYIPDITAILCSSILLISYGFMTNFSVSTNRAVVMLLVSFGSILIGRTYDLLSAMALSASIILLLNPFEILSSGFLLSFAAILGIGVVYPAFENLFLKEKDVYEYQEKTHTAFHFLTQLWKENEMHPLVETAYQKQFRLLYNKLLQSILFSLSINLMTFPIILYFYYQFPLYSIWLNLLIIPLASILLIFGSLLAVLGAKLTIVSYMIAGQIHCIFYLYETACQFVLRLPFSVITVGKPSIYKVSFYYICLGVFLIIEKYSRTFAFDKTHPSKLTIFTSWLFLLLHKLIDAKLYMILLVGCLCIVLPPKTNQLQITMLDVGQGDGILIEHPRGTTFFIDGGSTTLSNVGTYRIIPSLKAKGIVCIDYACITHMDEDHISGIRELIEQCRDPGAIRIRYLLLPDTNLKDDAFLDLVMLAHANKIAIQYLSQGDSIKEHDLLLTCLHPYKGFVTQERNNYSLVLSLQYRGFSALFTGDVSEEGEEALIEHVPEQSYDIFKVAHHGSKYTNSEKLLEKTRPKVSIVSAGAGNDYGHPHPETLQRLKQINSKSLCTIDYGALEIKTNGISSNIFGYDNSCKAPFPQKKRLLCIEK